MPEICKMDKEQRKSILDMLNKAASEEYITKWDDKGIPIILKKKSKITKGKKSRAKGISFELKVRKDLEEKGWIVDKWSNNVDLKVQKLTPAKRKFNPFSRVMTIGTGLPDFIAFQLMNETNKNYKVIGVEVKTNGYLDKEEKEKCKWLLKHKIFSEIWIAKKKKQGRKSEAEYKIFKDKNEAEI